MRLRLLFFILWLFPIVSYGNQQESTISNISTVLFNAEVEREIPHDLQTASLFIQTENSDLLVATTSVNKKIVQALDILKSFSAVNIQENSRSTQIRYDSSGKQNGWIARGQLVLQSKDNVILSQAISALDGVLAIESITSSLSSTALSTVEDEMTKQVLDKMQHKALVIQQSLQAKSYQIIELNVFPPVEQNDFNPKVYSAAVKSRSVSYDAPEIYLSSPKTNIKVRIEARISLNN